MILLEERARRAVAGVRAAGRAAAPTVRLPRRRPVLRGAAMAATAAVAVVVAIGLPLLLVGDDGERSLARLPVGGGAPTTTAVEPPTTTAPGPPLPGNAEVVAFSGPDWRLFVSEEPAGDAAWNTCYRLESDVGSGEPVTAGCSAWSETESWSGVVISAGPVLATDRGVVLLVAMTPQPVAHVEVTVGDVGSAFEVVPFRAPGSGGQFVAVEVPTAPGPVSIAFRDETGAVLDEVFLDSLAVLGG